MTADIPRLLTQYARLAAQDQRRLATTKQLAGLAHSLARALQAATETGGAEMTEEEFTPESPDAPEPPFRGPWDAPAGYSSGWEDGWKAGYLARKAESQAAKETYLQVRRQLAQNPEFGEIVQAVGCPYCGVQAGSPCVSPTDGMPLPESPEMLHTSRVEYFRAAEIRKALQSPGDPVQKAAQEIRKAAREMRTPEVARIMLDLAEELEKP